MAKNVVSVSPEAQQVAKLTAERAKLREKDVQLERDMRDIEEGLANEHSVGSLNRAANDLRERGVASLGDGMGLSEQQNQVSAQLRIVRRALQMNARDLLAAENAATVQATESLKADYVGLIREIKEKVTALQASLAKQAGFSYKLDQAGGSFGCGVLYPMGMDAGQFDHWLADAKAFYNV